MKRITDPDFKYVPAVETDIRKTFARIRKERAKAAEEHESQMHNVCDFLPKERRRVETK